PWLPNPRPTRSNRPGPASKTAVPSMAWCFPRRGTGETSRSRPSEGGRGVVLLLVVLVSVGAGVGAFACIRPWPQADPALSATATIGKDLSQNAHRRFLRSRMDPATATGLALTVALIGIVIAGIVVGVLAWMVRRDAGLVDIDHAIELWADRHATTFRDDGLAGLTHLRDTVALLTVGVAISAYGLWR